MRGLILVLILGVSLSLAEIQKYTGNQVIRVEAKTEKQVKALEALENEGEIDFWLEPRIVGPTDIMVTPEQFLRVKHFLKSIGLTYTTMIQDVEELIIEQRSMVGKADAKNINWTQYHRATPILAWLDSIAEEHPDIVTVQSIGTSTEQRDLKLIKIGYPGENKKAIWIDAGIHAREWISPAVATYFINELTTFREDKEEILRSVDFYILAVTNIDGYEFSHTNTRLWRKTRSNNNSTCMGVDPNRNFDYMFGGEGTSPDKCSEIYKGPFAFSEPETKAMRDFILNNAGSINWTVYIALHSYAQMVLSPWGYTRTLPDTFEELMDLGNFAANRLTAVHGTAYRVGSVTQLLSAGAGGSDDWAYGSKTFRYSYTFEIRDTGRYGFLLPANQIIPTGEETSRAFEAVAEYIMTHD